MPRPRICRRVFFEPNATYFKPAGIRLADINETILNYDEFESIRLVDFENTEQEKAAKKMKISQPTFSRLLKSARKKLADAIVNSKSIKIQGGVYKMAIPRRGAGLGRGGGRGLGRGIGAGGRGRMQGNAAGAGPSGYCVCPKCGNKIQHETGVPCYQMKCPKCGANMTRV